MAILLKGSSCILCNYVIECCCVHRHKRLRFTRVRPKLCHTRTKYPDVYLYSWILLWGESMKINTSNYCCSNVGIHYKMSHCYMTEILPAVTERNNETNNQRYVKQSWIIHGIRSLIINQSLETWLVLDLLRLCINLFGVRLFLCIFLVYYYITIYICVPHFYDLFI